MSEPVHQEAEAALEDAILDGTEQGKGKERG